MTKDCAGNDQCFEYVFAQTTGCYALDNKNNYGKSCFARMTAADWVSCIAM